MPASVLVTDGGARWARSSLAAVRALDRAGYQAVVGVTGPPSLASVSRHCHRRASLPSASDPSYPAAVRAEVASSGHVAVLPASDAALLALRAVGSHLTDKSVVSARAAAAGLPTLPEAVANRSSDLSSLATTLTWPVVAKPLRRRQGDPPAHVLARADQVAPLVQNEPWLLQSFVEGPLTAMSGVVYRGELRAVVAQTCPRLWPVAAGTAAWAETEEPDVARLAAVGQIVRDHEGIFQAQFVGPYLIDVNPRVYGSLPLAVASGANLPAIYCDLLRGRSVPWTVGRAGAHYRWVEGDVRNAIARRRRMPRRALIAQLRPRRGTTHSTESLTDPRPMVQRLGHVVSAVLRP